MSTHAHFLSYFNSHGELIARAEQTYHWERGNYIFYCMHCGKIYGRILSELAQPREFTRGGVWFDHRGECAECGDGTLIDWKYDDLNAVPIELAVHDILAATTKGAPQDEYDAAIVEAPSTNLFDFLADPDAWLTNARRWIEQNDRPAAIASGHCESLRTPHNGDGSARP